MSTYEVHAYDIVTGARVLADVPFTSFRWATTLSDLPLLDSQKRPEFTGVLAPDDSASLASLTPGKTILVVEDTEAGAPIYAGIIWTWVFNRAQHGFDVIGENVWSYWRRRFIVGSEGMTYGGATAELAEFVDVEQFDIVTDLIAHAVATGEAADLQFAGVRYRPSDTPSGVVQSTSWSMAQFRSVAAAVEELARVDEGFDFLVSYAWAGDALLLYLDLWYPRYGATFGTTLTDGDNVTVVKLDRPAYEMANPLVVVEIIDGPSAYLATVDDPNRADLGGTFPYLDGVFVTREHGRYPPGLEALGTARMQYTRGPVYNGQVSMQIGGALALGDVAPGDTVDLVATVGGLDVTETERVFASRVEIAAGELDVWSLDLVDEDASVGLSRPTGDVNMVAAVLAGMGGGGEAGELPAGMWAWWDFSDSHYFSYSGDRVSAVHDKSPSGHSLFQTVDANRPIMGARTINGLGVLDFDGAASPNQAYLRTADNTQAQPFTVFIVAESDVTGEYNFLLALDGGGGSGPQVVIDGGQHTYWAGTGAAGPQFGAVTTDPFMVSAVFGLGHTARLDEVPGTFDDPGSVGVAGLPVYVSGNSYDGSGWDGAIAEIIIYATELTEPEIETVEAYLLAKWF